MRRIAKAPSVGSTSAIGKRRRRSIARFVLALCIFASILATPSQAANRASLGSFATKTGEGGGHIGFGTGVAVNREGTGGVPAGAIYVSNFQNARVDEFSANGAFVRAFGWDVVATGADDTGANEQQTVTVPATVTAGTFKLKVTTATALGSTTTGSNVLTLVSGGLGAFRVGGPISGTNLPAGATITAVNTAEEKLTLSAAATGSGVNVALKSIEETQSVNFNASASGAGSVQEALEALPGIGGGGVTVTGGPGGTAPYLVTFSGGSLAHDDLEGMTVANSLTGGSASVADNTVRGGGIEVCSAGSSPLDQCKAGSKIANAGAINNPEGLAVDQLTGNVFVADNPNKRIDVFSAKGTFEGAFGWKVKAGAEEAATLQFCTVAGTGCKAGEANAGAGGFSNLTQAAMALDPTNGHLYVGERGNLRINEFSFSLNGLNEVTGVTFQRAFGWDVIPTGQPGDTGVGLETCTTSSTCKAGVSGGGDGQFPTSTPLGIAVDSAGFIYAVTSPTSSSGTCNTTTIVCRVQKFNPDGTFKETFGPTSGGPTACQLTWTSNLANTEAAGGVAVDPSNQHVIVTTKTDGTHFGVCEFDSSGTLLDRSPPSPLPVNTAGYLQPSIGNAGLVYVNTEITAQVGAVDILGPVPPPTVACLSPTEVGPTGFKLNGSVTVPPPGGEGFEPKYHFEYSGDNGLTWTRVPTPDAALGTSSPGTVSVSAQISELQPSSAYRWRLVATTSSSASCEGSLVNTQSARPTVEHVRALPIGDTTATLRADVNPNNSGTTYRFEWGTTTAYGNQAPAFEPFIGSGGKPVAASADLGGLMPGAIYHFRILATNASGTTASPDVAFTAHPCPYEDAEGLPDCRRFELVSPPDKGPVGEAGQAVATGSDLQPQVSPDGDKLAYLVGYGLPDAPKGGEASYVATRGSSGWQSTPLTPSVFGQNLSNDKININSRTLWLSADLRCGFLLSAAPLSGDPTEMPSLQGGGANLYRREPDGTYTLVPGVAPTNTNVTFGGGGIDETYHVFGASEDCHRVVFTSGQSATFPGYKFPGVESGFYEWNEGVLRDVAAIPGAAGPVAAQPGSNGDATWHAVTSHGTFFTATSAQGGDIGSKAVFFRRDDGTAAVDVSQSQTPTSNSGGSTFQMASADGSQVFFTARYGLAANGSSTGVSGCSPGSSGRGTGCDLYRYSIESGALIDISADSNPVDIAGAGVVGMVDASADGSRIYFAAQGRLVPGQGNSYAENIAGTGAYNIYLAKIQGSSVRWSFVATIPRTDLSNGKVNLLVSDPTALAIEGEWRSRATPDGEHLLFLSAGNLVGYDSGGVAEAYLYSAASGTTVCVSCRPDGQPSIGTALDSPLPFLDPPLVAGHTHPRQSISDDGSEVFFKMPDVLAPGAQSGQANLYEWHDGQVSLVATDIPGLIAQYKLSFLGISPDGGSAFFKTKRALVPQDTDERNDVYVARVDGGFPPAASPSSPCNPLSEGSCQGDGTGGSTSAQVTPGSSSFVGSGNQTPPTLSCRKKGKVRRHDKCVPKNSGRKKRSGKTDRKRGSHARGAQ